MLTADLTFALPVPRSCNATMHALHTVNVIVLSRFLPHFHLSSWLSQAGLPLACVLQALVPSHAIMMLSMTGFPKQDSGRMIAPHFPNKNLPPLIFGSTTLHRSNAAAISALMSPSGAHFRLELVSPSLDLGITTRGPQSRASVFGHCYDFCLFVL